MTQDNTKEYVYMVGKMSYTASNSEDIKDTVYFVGQLDSGEKIDGRTIKVSKFCRYFNKTNKEDEFIIDEEATYQVQLYCEKWLWDDKTCYRILGIRFDKKISNNRLEENPFDGRPTFEEE